MNKKTMIQRICLLLTVVLWIGAMPNTAAAKGTDCKNLCKTALQATGGSSHLKYTSSSTIDFGGLSFSARKKVKKICYVCDDKEAYSLCVMQTKTAADAKKLVKELQKYKKRNCGSGYLHDYSKEEQNVFKNAIYGAKKTYVWYIAMSQVRTTNLKGQTAIKKKI